MSSLQLTLVARHLTGSQETADLCTPHQTHLEACMTFECKMQPLIMVVFMQITIIAITIQSNYVHYIIQEHMNGRSVQLLEMAFGQCNS